MHKLTTILLLLCLTEIQYHTLAVLHAHQVHGPWHNIIPELVDNIANGNDYYMHTAQRILLPLPLKFIALKLGLSLKTVWLVSIWLMLALCNFITYYTLSGNPASRHVAAAFTVIQAAAFICWQDWFMLGPYDLADKIIWFLCAYGVWLGKRWHWFAALFVIELHNREVAIFFPLWVAFQNLLPLSRDRTRWVIGLLALAAIPLGMLYTNWLRIHMRSGLELALNPDAIKGQFINWHHNLKLFAEAFGGTWSGHPYSAAYSATRYEIWATIASMGISTIACIKLGLSWFSCRVILFICAWWAVCLISAVITEQRSLYAIAPLLMFALFKIEPEAER